MPPGFRASRIDPPTGSSRSCCASSRYWACVIAPNSRPCFDQCSSNCLRERNPGPAASSTATLKIQSARRLEKRCRIYFNYLGFITSRNRLSNSWVFLIEVIAVRRWMIVLLALIPCAIAQRPARAPAQRAVGKTARKAAPKPPPKPMFDVQAVNDPSTNQTLQPKDTGSAALRAQILLDRRNFSVGSIDGRLG